MTRIRIIPSLVLALALVANTGYAQGQGQGKGKADDRKAGQAAPARGNQAKGQQNSPGKAQKADNDAGRGQGNAQARQTGKPDRADSDNRGNSGSAGRGNASKVRGKGSFKGNASVRDLDPSLRRYAASSRVPERVAAGALAYAFARGIDRNELNIDNSNNRVRVKNRKGDVLVDLDDERARNLGAWDVRPLNDDDDKEGAPAFCRSGAGHPVWGRQWCADKGFGLGNDNDIRWGRTTGTLGDIIFGRRIVDRETLLRDALVSTVGNVVLDRLGLHALTLGYTEPITGTWVAQPTGPQVLMLNSGTYPVAEVVDNNRDGRADVMLVALRPW